MFINSLQTLASDFPKNSLRSSALSLTSEAYVSLKRTNKLKICSVNINIFWCHTVNKHLVALADSYIALPPCGKKKEVQLDY